MQKLLLSTALVASTMFSGIAFAQSATPLTDAQGNPLYTWTVTEGGNATLYEGTLDEYNTAAGALAVGAEISEVTVLLEGADDPAPYTSTSLLDNILGDVDALSASLTNVAQNLNDVNGSIDINTDRAIGDFSAVIDSLVGDNPGFGSYSQVNASVYGSDLPASLLSVLNPLTLELGNLGTTAIGSLQSGNMTATFDASGILAKASSTADGSTTGASMLAEQYGSIADTLALQNASINSGAIDGSIALVLNDVNTKTGNLATTAIGALGSGAMTANISGQLGTVDSVGSGLVSALVGAP